MGISSTGIGSGLDVKTIVSQLVALERQPIDKLKTEQSSLQTKISSYGKVQSLMSTLRDASATLGRASLWTQTTATSSDSTIVGATATGKAAAGEYMVSVTNMARAQTLYSAATPTTSSVVGAGTMSLQLVQSYGPPATPKDGAASLDLSFTDPNTTMEDVSSAINAAKAGISASVVRDINGAARLALTSAETGLNNQIMVSTTGVGFSDFTYPPNALTGAGMTQGQAAQNAQLTINGVPAESTTNDVSNALTGLTLTIGKESATPVKITVANDQAAQKKAMEDFVSAYNALNNYLAEQTKYDPATKTAATLQGDSSILGLRSKMRSMLQSTGGASSTYDSLSALGMQMQKDGTLKLDSTKAAAALKTPDELSKLFANVDTNTPSNNGFGVILRDFVDTATGTDGMLTTRTSGLQGRVKRNQDNQSREEERVARVQARLEKQYQALDTKMSSLNALSGYVSQQITLWNKSSSNS